jgi:hypothetical protein
MEWDDSLITGVLYKYCYHKTNNLTSPNGDDAALDSDPNRVFSPLDSYLGAGTIHMSLLRVVDIFLLDFDIITIDIFTAII